jgi:plastocyanin
MQARRRARAVAVTMAVTIAMTSALAVAAIGIGTMGAASAGTVARAKTYTITISNFMFSPMTLRVPPGAVVAVTNKDSVDHTITANDKKFNTGDIGHDQTKRFKAPRAPGTYTYVCSIHQFMTGSIIVK